MSKFPVDAPKGRVIKALGLLGFIVVREREHIALVRENADGTRTPLTMPNHSHIQGLDLTQHLLAGEHPAGRISEGLRAKLNRGDD